MAPVIDQAPASPAGAASLTGRRTPVHIVADRSARLIELHALVEPLYGVRSGLLDDGIVGCGKDDVAVVAADLQDPDTIAAIKKLHPAITRARKRIFLIEPKTHHFVVQAYALGATSVLQVSSDWRKELLWALSECGLANVAPADVPVVPADDPRGVAAAGAAALAAMFLSVLAGKPIDVEGAHIAAVKIADSVAERGLSVWLDTVRRYHLGTYQHCLLVTGIAVDFGLKLGLARRDLERLYSAAIFHDIGKARVPLVVLDKPDKLDDDERALIETHPGAGYDILKDTRGVSAEILDAVRHHHEYLDGSGYPDKLSAENISDVVRILTISDIFAALIEHRPYRPRMPREKAFDILQGMHGKLEMPLVNVFRDVALNR